MLALVVARIAWGFWGGSHARFSDFVPSPAALADYARAWVQGRPPRHLGHNPLGAVMVLGLLAVGAPQKPPGLLRRAVDLVADAAGKKPFRATSSPSPPSLEEVISRQRGKGGYSACASGARSRRRC